jgi:hypothetical protein
MIFSLILAFFPIFGTLIHLPTCNFKFVLLLIKLGFAT